jgi:ATP-binding cassette subfamily F protein uup
VIYYADYKQWLADLKKNAKGDKNLNSQVAEKKSAPKKKQSKVGKLSYLDQREYEQMEEKIMEAEEAKELLQALMDDPETAKNPQKLESTWTQFEEIKQQVEQLYERWDELEEKKLSA